MSTLLEMKITIKTILLIFLLQCISLTHHLFADSVSDNPIVFVTMVPNPADFGTLAATFGNHIANPDTAFRGGDLWIRYPDGTLRNLTEAAGYGNTGFQGATSIAVRDPAVYWDGTKIIFSMVVGAATQRYQVTSHKWQLYEMTGIGSSETPVITLVTNQPTAYNNISPAYASDDTIIFSSDRPRDNSVLHTYPQRDEYESSPVTTGLWKLNPTNGTLEILDHAPSGDFNPIVDSFGRVIFTRWDHLQRDQQNIGASMGAFNYASEVSTQSTSSNAEVFPEPRSVNDPDKESTVNLFTINQFIPWMMNQDGTDLETLNHIGRQEIGLYSERNFNNDPNVQEFYGQYSTGQNQNEFTIFLHIKEDPTTPGTYFGTNCQEFGTHSSGQLLSITGAPGVNPNDMVVTYLTHPDTAGATNTPSGNHSGLYRDPLPLSNGKLISSHTTETRQDSNTGSSSAPQSRYAMRIKLLNKSGSYFTPLSSISSGISKSVSFWSPDQMVSYNGVLWEMMPVEVKSRTRPQAPAPSIPSVEASVFTSMGVNVEELTNYLKSQNLALVISRNLTVRDKNDRQQPTNLKIFGSNTQSVPNSGKIYDLTNLEFFQGDLIRGYSNGNSSGRRVIAQRMHSVDEGINPIISGAQTGSVKIAEDGSMAAFVPAKRSLSWQMVGSDGKPVVRERYWVTFQPGEIRVCASCHGVNTVDHLGNPPPTNPPLALAQLLAHWKNLPAPVPTATPTANPTVTPPTSSTPNPEKTPGSSEYSLSVSGQTPGGKFSITANGKSEDTLILKASINGTMCKKTSLFSKAGVTRILNGNFPKIGSAKIKFLLHVGKNKKAQATKQIKLSRTKRSVRSVSVDQGCAVLMKLKK